MNANPRAYIGSREGPDSLGGYNAIVYNRPGGGNDAGIPQVPLTRMTIGQVLNFQRNQMLPRTRGRRGRDDPGTSAVGRYQFVSGTLESRARDVFGDNYKNVVFDEATQDRLFDKHYAETARRGFGALKQQWASLA